MLIGIDASRVTVQQRTGTEGYSYHLINNLLALDSDHRFRLYFRDQPDTDLFPPSGNVEYAVIDRRRIWTHLGLGPEVRKNPNDVLFVPSHVVPWPGIGSTPAVVTIHDLGYLHYPDKHPLTDRIYLDWSTRHSARAARRVIAVSQATAHDLVALNNVNGGKIKVVHSGVAPSMHPAGKSARQQVCERLGIVGPYILHVGSVQPRKNLLRLVEAFERVKDLIPGLQLVLSGRESWGTQRLMERITERSLQERVLLTGYISDEDLVPLYSGAAIYAFPSLYEGFGFPALEAMACGTPVVCSNVSSLPELVGDAALTFPPTDVVSIATALKRLLLDEELRANMVQRGLERSQSFTWRSAASKTLAVLEEASGL